MAEVRQYSMYRKEPGHPLYIVLSRAKNAGRSIPANQFTLSPNPASSQLKVSFTLTTTAKVAVQLLGIDGKEFRIFNAGLLAKGSHNVSFNLQGMAAGTCWVKLTVGGSQQSRIFIKQ